MGASVSTELIWRSVVFDQNSSFPQYAEGEVENEGLGRLEQNSRVPKMSLNSSTSPVSFHLFSNSKVN